MRPSRGTGGPLIRGHHPVSPSLGERPYSSNPSRRQILWSCRHPPYGGGYLHGHLVSFRTIKSIAGSDATMQALDRDRTSVLCHYCDQLGHSKEVSTPSQTQPPAAAAAYSASSATTTWSTSGKAAQMAAKQRWRVGTPFLSKHHQICFPRPGGSRRNKISSPVVRLQRRHARRQLRFARRDAAERAGLQFRFGVWRRHVCRNGRITSASTSLPRRNFASGSLACGIFARGSYTGGIITSTNARESPGAGARQDQRLHLLLRHQRQLTETPIVVPWESRLPLRTAEP